MKTSIYLFGLFSLVQVACGQNKEKKVPMFEWSATMSCPVGYPVDVIEGDLTGNGFETLKLGTHYGPWGAQGRSWGSSMHGLPNKLYAFWISYAERQFYIIDTEIDYEKILSAFQKGYIWRNANNILVKHDFDYVNVGFAPGGVVVLWVQGATETLEIARYQGRKITLPERYGKDFDSHSRLVFDPDYWEEIMTNEKIVPIEVQEANKNKPVPYGLWDEFSIKYPWKIKFENEDMEFFDVRYQFINGELKFEHYTSENYLMPYPKALSNYIVFYSKKDMNMQYRININLEELMGAFKKLSEQNQEILMCIKVLNDSVLGIVVKSGDNEIPIKNVEVQSGVSSREFN